MYVNKGKVTSWRLLVTPFAAPSIIKQIPHCHNSGLTGSIPKTSAPLVSKSSKQKRPGVMSKLHGRLSRLSWQINRRKLRYKHCVLCRHNIEHSTGDRVAYVPRLGLLLGVISALHWVKMLVRGLETMADISENCTKRRENYFRGRQR
jgi:hypothetical protein